ncbi:hypothetical protein [Serratia phage SP1]|nr:hypothetical protein [Serratia phage SP1]
MTEQEIKEIDLELDSLAGETQPVPDSSDTKKALDDGYSKLQEALKTVKHEMLLIDKTGKAHIAYIHGMNMMKNQFVVDFSTPSEDKQLVSSLIDECLAAVAEDVLKSQSESKSSWFGKFRG